MNVSTMKSTRRLKPQAQAQAQAPTQAARRTRRRVGPERKRDLKLRTCLTHYYVASSSSSSSRSLSLSLSLSLGASASSSASSSSSSISGARRGTTAKVQAGRSGKKRQSNGGYKTSGGSASYKKDKNNNHSKKNSREVEDLLSYVRRGKLDACVRALSQLSVKQRKEALESVYLKRFFMDMAKKYGASREAYAFLIEADKVDGNLISGNLIYYDTRMATRVVGVCARGGDSALAQRTMEYLSTEKGLQLDIFMYTSAINACAKKGEVERACKLFRQSEIEDGLEPDVFMYCALLKVFRQAMTRKGGKSGRGYASSHSSSRKRSPLEGESQSENEVLLEKALGYVELMKEQGIVGDVVLYNCLLSTCGRADNLEKAEGFFWEMQTLGVQPNSKTYSILIQCCLSSKEGEKALDYFRDAREQKEVINAHIVAQAVQAHSMLKAGTEPEEALSEARRIYKELEIEGIVMDGVASASLVSLASDLGHHEIALEILNEISTSSVSRERIPPEPFAVAADMCAKQKNIEGAKWILRQIEENSNLFPNHELGSSLINAFSKAGDLVTSFEVLELLLSRECLPNSYSFSGLLYACAFSGLPVLALKLYELAKQMGAIPESESLYGVWCSSVLHAYLKTRREGHTAENGSDVYIQRISQDIDDRLQQYNGGSRAQRYHGDSSSKEEIVTGIKQIYREAIRKGYKPSVKVLDMMLECMCTDFYVERIQKATPDPRHEYAPSVDVSEGAGLFETGAFALFEEASEMGVLPPCVSQSDLEIKIDFRQLGPVVAEVCLLVLLRSLKRRLDSSEGKHEFKSLLLLLPAKKDSSLSSFDEEESSGSGPQVDRKVKSLLRFIGMEYVMVDREDRYESDCALCIVRPKTMKKVLSNDTRNLVTYETYEMFDTDLERQQSQIRMEYYDVEQNQH